MHEVITVRSRPYPPFCSWCAIANLQYKFESDSTSTFSSLHSAPPPDCSVCWASCPSIPPLAKRRTGRTRGFFGKNNLAAREQATATPPPHNVVRNCCYIASLIFRAPLPFFSTKFYLLAKQWKRTCKLLLYSRSLSVLVCKSPVKWSNLTFFPTTCCSLRQSI